MYGSGLINSICYDVRHNIDASFVSDLCHVAISMVTPPFYDLFVAHYTDNK